MYRTFVYGNYEKKFTFHRHVFAASSATWDSGIARQVHGKKLSRLAGCTGQVDRAPRLGGLPCLSQTLKCVQSKDTYEKLAYPG